MKVVVKDKEGKTVFESSEGEIVDILLDHYDVYRMRTHNGSMVANDIRSITITRMQGAPDYKEENNA